MNQRKRGRIRERRKAAKAARTEQAQEREEARARAAYRTRQLGTFGAASAVRQISPTDFGAKS